MEAQIQHVWLPHLNAIVRKYLVFCESIRKARTKNGNVWKTKQQKQGKDSLGGSSTFCNLHRVVNGRNAFSARNVTKTRPHHLNNYVGLRDVNRGVPHLAQTDAIYQGIHSKRPEDARPLTLWRGAVDVRDAQNGRVLSTQNRNMNDKRRLIKNTSLC